ncbi:MAG: DNA mismatch repair endonuclease MutL [Methanomicrobiales archaeon]|nr:DNA mismatch repair endonuclease MutL [Methanomicrobiales archaeon]
MTAAPGSPSIRVLDTLTVNQIAAGEVVERPSSVVKELAENSLDAGASHITVDVESARGEIRRITVMDNGSGMVPADAVLAFHPHATSKIRALSDLHRSLTLGFRGEALTSIASVARVELVTRPSGGRAAEAWRVVVEGGEIREQGVAAGPEGTRVTVEQLFARTPARRKFLKSLATEISHIAGVVESLALSHPRVAFRLVHNGTERIRTEGDGDLRAVIAGLYGADLVRVLIPLTLEGAGFGVRGYVSKPSEHRPHPYQVFLSVNGRPVSSRQMVRAIRDGYGTLLPPHRYPVAFLDLRIDPAWVDVNVHPSKRQVRLTGERDLLEAVTGAVAQTLRGKDLMPEAGKGLLPVGGPARPVAVTVPPPVLPAPTWGDGIPLRVGRQTEQQLRQTELATGIVEDRVPLPTMEVIGQAGGVYLVARTPEGGLILVDQHAAHERVVYEYLRDLHSGGERSQELLVPLVLHRSPREAALLREFLPVLARQGLVVEEFGRDTFAVKAVPVVLGRTGDDSVIHEVLGDLLCQQEDPSVTMEERVIRIIACRSAVKAGAAVTLEQSQRLVRQLARARNPYTCPHGRPTMVALTRAQLDGMFRRV